MSLQRVLDSLYHEDPVQKQFLDEFSHRAAFQSICKVFESIELGGNRYNPTSKQIVREVTETYDYLRCYPSLAETEELLEILRRPHMKAIVQVMETVSNKDFLPTLPHYPHEVDEDDVSLKVVQLIKDHEPLGTTIKINERNGAVLLARIMHGGIADRCGALAAGDEVQEINDNSVYGRDPMEVIKMLTTISGNLKLKVYPTSASGTNLRGRSQSNSDSPTDAPESGTIVVRALFSYNPNEDRLAPCKEAGLTFRCGDLLQLVNTEDIHWWQALHYQDANQRAGLIPSRQLQEKKELYRQTCTSGGNVDPAASSTHSNRLSCGSDGIGGRKMKISSVFTSSVDRHSRNKKSVKPEVVGPDLRTYVEMDRYFPNEGHFRPIVLVGASKVGKSELIQQLILTDPGHFCEPLHITSRQQRADEISGRDYTFVTREEFENLIQLQRMVTFELSQGAYSGLPVDGILQVMKAGKVPVMKLNSEALIHVCNGLVRPFVIFVKPPALEVLRETRRVNHRAPVVIGECERRAATPNVDEAFTEEDFSAMLSESAMMEQALVGQYADWHLVNDDLPVALETLSELAYRLETESFYVPKTWLTTSHKLI